MNIGSLFVELGTKGAGSAIRGIRDLKDGLSGASIVANQTIQMLKTMYEATSEVVKQNAQLGTSILNNSKDLDVSTEALQRWEYASKLSGAKAGEMSSSFRQLQRALLDIRDGDVPEYFAYLFSEMSKVDQGFDADRFLGGDLEYAMSSIRKLAKNGEYDLSRLNKALSSLGFSDSISTFLRLSDVDLSKISKDLIISDKGVKNLDAMNKGIIEIGQVMSTVMADIAQVFDKEFISEIKSIIKDLAVLVREMIQLIKDSGLIKTTGSIVRGTSNLVKKGGSLVKESTEDEVARSARFRSIMDEYKKGGSKQLGVPQEGNPMTLNIVNNIQTTDDAVAIVKGISDTLDESIVNAMSQMFPSRAQAGGNP